ncbi:tannase/feruloyl esterase family alpha/beta hydrolase [Nocardioides carbamazepini]|uniref:tannase/feruloyl esterase family alpha/beta hydrolase n=1 Tax=Nocardioides carbamazepini TaxID=2854259 RepID=UPI00214A79F1|nr:tannase/feruloyl esterase family alpha/beta hydrolase [Nocardioides carbamazepini]MCR1786302.1 tannase/feruloyl esterase family alpha/beta hydrolase [Nocardioides carbamazepini]
MNRTARLALGPIALVLAATGLAAVPLLAGAEPPAEPPAAEPCAAARLSGLEVVGAEVTGVDAVANSSGATRLTPPLDSAAPDLPFCEVQLTLTHGVEGGFGPDQAHVWLWLPDAWNGRLQAVGGGGTRATNGPGAMAPALADGYAVVASDSGVPDARQPNIFLTPEEDFDWQLFENWTYRGVRDATVLAQAAVARYYGEPAAYSYWNGCSNGGRQGMAMAQRFPDLFDGVLAAAPALYGADRLNMTMSWPAVVQNERLGGLLPACKLAAMRDAVLAACDGGDGLGDGLISRPERCDYRAALDSVVGAKLPCGKVKKADVAAAVEIFRGPHEPDGRAVWYGHTPGVDLTGGVVRVPPSFALQNFAFADLSYDWRQVSTRDLVTTVRARLQGRLELLATADPALDTFAETGGKVLMWHGLADGLFPADQSIHYYEEVRTLSGAATDDFLRLFLAPGVDHCRGGAGPQPVDPFEALVRWVEDGEAPETLPASGPAPDGGTRDRGLCPYPQVQVYRGGDPDLAASFACADA